LCPHLRLSDQLEKGTAGTLYFPAILDRGIKRAMLIRVKERTEEKLFDFCFQTIPEV
jgi:hypothetical protein